MAQLIYDTSLEEKGPWLLDMEDIEKLDTITLEVQEELTAYRDKAVKSEIANQYDNLLRDANCTDVDSPLAEDLHRRAEDIVKHSRINRTRHSLTLYFKSGRKLIVGSFQEATKTPAVQCEIPIGFDLQIASADVDCRLSVGPRRDELSLQVSPENCPESHSTFMAFSNWVTSVRSPIWLRYWHRWSGLQWIILSVAVALTLAFILTTDLISSTLIYSSSHLKEANRLLAEGVTSENVPRAVELLLAIHAGTLASQSTSSIAWRHLVWLVFGIAACIALCFVPKTCLGIGRGQASLRRWKWWSRLVWVTIPSFIFLGFIEPYLVRLIETVFR